MRLRASPAGWLDNHALLVGQGVGEVASAQRTSPQAAIPGRGLRQLKAATAAGIEDADGSQESITRERDWELQVGVVRDDNSEFVVLLESVEQEV